MLYRKFYDELVKWHKQEKKLALLIDDIWKTAEKAVVVVD